MLTVLLGIEVVKPIFRITARAVMLSRAILLQRIELSEIAEKRLIKLGELLTN